MWSFRLLFFMNCISFVKTTPAAERRTQWARKPWLLLLLLWETDVTSSLYGICGLKKNRPWSEKQWGDFLVLLSILLEDIHARLAVRKMCVNYIKHIWCVKAFWALWSSWLMQCIWSHYVARCLLDVFCNERFIVSLSFFSCCYLTQWIHPIYIWPPRPLKNSDLN